MIDCQIRSHLFQFFASYPVDLKKVIHGMKRTVFLPEFNDTFGQAFACTRQDIQALCIGAVDIERDVEHEPLCGIDPGDYYPCLARGIFHHGQTIAGC